jgi:hypothetical protein
MDSRPAVVDVELAVNVLRMGAHSAQGDHEFTGDLWPGKLGFEQKGRFALAGPRSIARSGAGAKPALAGRGGYGVWFSEGVWTIASLLASPKLHYGDYTITHRDPKYAAGTAQPVKRADPDQWQDEEKSALVRASKPPLGRNYEDGGCQSDDHGVHYEERRIERRKSFTWNRVRQQNKRPHVERRMEQVAADQGAFPGPVVHPGHHHRPADLG